MNKKNIVLGILGGGQLGRMAAMAAAKLGIHAHIYAPEENSPAFDVTPLKTQADYNNHNKLKEFAANVDYITYEFENIPLETIQFLQDIKPVYPGAALLEISQNRLKEKDFLKKIGIETALWSPAYSAKDIEQTLDRWNQSKCIIKTTRFGYDGKGQIKHEDNSSFLTSWKTLNTQEAIIEGIVDFTYEISCIAARDVFGKCMTYPVTLNHHKNHILSESVAPAPIPYEISVKAKEMTIRLAEAVNLVGVLALEMFVLKDGSILANEIAPRTHNSGHWTLDGCNISQFEQQVRAACCLPVLQPLQHSAVKMVNLIGNDIERLPEYYAMENVSVHLYGKTETREGRKMGHVNILEPLKGN
jgi:5-(carboxyamino)imidazole ribonucleotide synthase